MNFVGFATVIGQATPVATSSLRMAERYEMKLLRKYNLIFAQSMDRSALERYLHYFHRYNSHEQSKKFEQALRQAAVAKMV